MTAIDELTRIAGAVLSPAERATLACVCDALFPRLEPGAGDDPPLFTTDATALGVPDAMLEALGSASAEQRQDVRLLLRALDNPLFVMSMVGRARGIRALDHAGRERLLLAMATSAVPLARKGFQALKRLASFLFFSVVDASGANPVWPGIGYAPSSNLPGRRNALSLTIVDAPTVLDCDACVVGSGAGGGVVAAQLTARGLEVIVLEQGAGDQAEEFDQREIVGMDRLYLERGTTSTRDLSVAILAGSCVGGGTTVNWQTSLRLPDAIRDEWSARSGIPLFSTSRFTAAMNTVWARCAVGVDEHFINANNDVIRRGCSALGWEWTHAPRNAAGCDAAQCGDCVFGCRRGGKQGTAVTYLADAQRTGRLRIVPWCRALRVMHERGSVTGVRAEARDPRGVRAPVEVEIRAPRVFVAAGGIESPALLLRSGVRSSALGAHLHLHPTSAVAGRYDAPVWPWAGAPQTVMSDAHASLEQEYGVRIEAAPAHPGLLALALPWFGAREHRAWMQRAAHVGALIALTRDESAGRVGVRRDGRAVIDYRPGKRELAHLRRGVAAAARIHVAAGARAVLSLHARPHALSLGDEPDPRAVDAFCRRLEDDVIDRNWSTLFSAHQMGTCRMGNNPRSAVCDERGAVYGMDGLYVADASLFPASSGVNPMITVMALATIVGSEA